MVGPKCIGGGALRVTNAAFAPEGAKVSLKPLHRLRDGFPWFLFGVNKSFHVHCWLPADVSGTQPK